MRTATINGSFKSDGRQKPPPFEICRENLPQELVSLDRWLGWNWEWEPKRGKWEKPPIDARNGGMGASTKSETWCDFSTALAAAEAHEVDGIGIALGELADGLYLVGVDFDDCRNPSTGAVDCTVVEFVRLLGTYCEVSPSGEGVKCFCLGVLPGGRRIFELHDGIKVELYQSGRYFTTTGHIVDFGSTSLTNCTNQLCALHEALAAGREAAPDSHLPNRELALSALEALNPRRADDYHDWLYVGMALKSVADDLLDDWDRWSEQSDKYAPGVCAEKWATFRGEGITLGSLVFWAKHDGWTPPQRRSAPLLTDMGNAERFAADHGADVRYIHAWKKWLPWNGKRWKVDDTGAAMRLAKTTARGIFAEAAEVSDEFEQRKIAKWAMTSQSKERLNAMLELAQSEQPIPATYGSLDADPWLLNCDNGTVDLRTGALRPHKRGDLLTKTTGVEYPDDAGVDAVLWRKFLNETFEEDQALIGFGQRLFGASLVGKHLEHVLAILHGGGSNGKTVFLLTVQAAMGEYAMAAPRNFLMVKRNSEHPTALADLFGRRLVVVSETQDEARLDEGLVKSITGGDRIRARGMREDFWEFSPSHLPVIATNHKPVIRGTDYGIWRRLRLIPFNVTIPPEREDKRLEEKLRPELPAILRWLVEGCLAWQSRGLDEPSAVSMATEQYRAESDTIARWIEESCIKDPEAEWKAKLARESYECWCEDAGKEPMGATKFGKRMQELFLRLPRRKDGFYYRGIRESPGRVNGVNGVNSDPY